MHDRLNDSLIDEFLKILDESIHIPSGSSIGDSLAKLLVEDESDGRVADLVIFVSILVRRIVRMLVRRIVGIIVSGAAIEVFLVDINSPILIDLDQNI
jgi:hypothetical protein